MEAADVRLRNTLSWIAAGLVAATALAGAWAVVSQTGRYERLLADFPAKLPTVTVFVLANHYLIAGFLLLTAVGGVAKEFFVQDRVLTLVVNAMLLLVVLAVMFVCVYAVRAPLTVVPAPVR